MTDCWSVTTTLDHNQKLPHDSGTTCYKLGFGQIVGSLIYLTITWPDLSYLFDNMFAFSSGRIMHNWKDKEYSVRFQGFFNHLTKNVIPLSHVLKDSMEKLKISPCHKIEFLQYLANVINLRHVCYHKINNSCFW